MPLLRRKLLPSLATTLLAFSGLTAGAAQAIEFRSLTEAAIVYDAPSTEGRRLFILRPGTPVEIVVTLDQWIKVREPSGSLSWIERRVLAKRRTLLVTAERATWPYFVRRCRLEGASKAILRELTGPESGLDR